MHLSVQPSNGHFFGDTVHWFSLSIPAASFFFFTAVPPRVLRRLLHLQITFTSEDWGKHMFSCIKTQEGLAHSHAQQNWQTASENPKNRKCQYPSMKSLAADLCRPKSWFSLLCRVLICCLFVQRLQQKMYTICIQLYIFLKACVVVSNSIFNSNKMTTISQYDPSQDWFEQQQRLFLFFPCVVTFLKHWWFNRSNL